MKVAIFRCILISWSLSIAKTIFSNVSILTGGLRRRQYLQYLPLWNEFIIYLRYGENRTSNLQIQCQMIKPIRNEMFSKIIRIMHSHLFMMSCLWSQCEVRICNTSKYLPDRWADTRYQIPESRCQIEVSDTRYQIVSMYQVSR